MTRWLALLFALGALERLWALGGPGLSGDEAGCVYFASFPLQRLVEAILASNEVHPPGFFVLTHGVLEFGTSEFVLRLPSVLFGLATVGIAWKLFQSWDGAVAPWAAGLLAVSTYHVQASRELRMYSLLTLLVVIALSCLWKWSQEGQNRWLAGYALASALSYWIHYLSFFALPVGFLWMLRLRPRAWGKWLVALAGSGLPFLAWVPVLMQQVGGQNLMIRPAPGLATPFETLGRIAGGDLGPEGSRAFFVLGVAVLLLCGSAARRTRVGTQLSLIWLFVPMLVLAGLSTFTPLRLFEFKYFAWCSPALFWLLAASLEGRGRAALAGLLVAVNLYTFTSIFAHYDDYGPNWRSVAGLLRQTGPDDLLLVHPSMMAQPLLYYGVPPARMTPVDGLTAEQLEALVQGRSTVFLVTPPHHPFVVEQRLEQRLDRLMHREREWETRPRLPSGWLRVVRFKSRDSGAGESGAD